MQGTLQQQSIEVEDAMVVQELFYQNEWTDGLPVVPPTKDKIEDMLETCLLYTSPSPRDVEESRMPSSA